MSKLEQAGDNNTTSVGKAFFAASETACTKSSQY
jgi:hypothetical protein